MLQVFIFAVLLNLIISSKKHLHFRDRFSFGQLFNLSFQRTQCNSLPIRPHNRRYYHY